MTDQSFILDANLRLNYDWLTVEAFNHIMKAWVECLIKLGASIDLRETVFKVWMTYLKKKKYAFRDIGGDSEEDPGELELIHARLVYYS